MIVQQSIKEKCKYFKTFVSSSRLLQCFPPHYCHKKAMLRAPQAPAGGHPHTDPANLCLDEPASPGRVVTPRPTATRRWQGLPLGTHHLPQKTLHNQRCCFQPTHVQGAGAREAMVPFTKPPSPAPVSPALKTHYGLRGCVPHVFQKAQTRLTVLLPFTLQQGKFHGQDQGGRANRKCSLLEVLLCGKGQTNTGHASFIPRAAA